MGTQLRPAVRRHPDRPAARRRAPPTPTTSARSPAPSAARSAPPATPRNAIVLADGLVRRHAGVRARRDDHGRLRRAVRAPTNVHNRGGLTSILFSRDGAAAPGAARWGWWPEGFLHEMTHNLGAVQWGAPHSTQPRGQAQPAVRPLLAGRGRHVLRRGRRRRARDADRLRGPPRRDPAELRLRPRRLLQPGAGRRAPTWRRTGTRTTRPSWRPAARSPRPAAAASCGCPSRPRRPPRPTVAGSAAPRLDADAPAPAAGATARRATPTSGSASSAAGWEDIDSATGATYVVTSEDLGRRLRVTVIATNPDGSASAASDPTAPVGAAGVNRAASHRPPRRARRSRGQGQDVAKKKKAAKKKAEGQEEGQGQEEGSKRR